MSPDTSSAEIAEAARFPAENPNPVFRVAADGVVLYANRASRGLLNMWRVDESNRIPPLWQARCAEVLTAGAPRIWDAACEDRIYQLHCVPITGSGYVNVYASDVTARHQAELERAAALQELEQRVAERTAELAASREELRAYARSVVEAAEKDRRALTHGVHGEAAQSLWALRLALGALRQKIADDRFSADFDRLDRYLSRALADTHRLSAYLGPVGLYLYGLVPALRQHAVALSVGGELDVTFTAVGADGLRLPAEMEIGLYELVQEALATALLHAQAKHVAVHLEHREGRVMLTIRDDGLGWRDGPDPDAAVEQQARRRRILTMRERAAMLEGVLTVSNAPGNGTTVSLVAPLPASVPPPAPF